jgi:hypothetical protein
MNAKAVDEASRWGCDWGEESYFCSELGGNAIPSTNEKPWSKRDGHKRPQSRLQKEEHQLHSTSSFKPQTQNSPEK